MSDSFKPQVDPWELMIEHNQRIQRLENAANNHRHKIEDLISTVNNLNAIMEQQQKTIMKILDIQQQHAVLQIDLLNKSTPNSTGQH